MIVLGKDIKITIPFSVLLFLDAGKIVLKDSVSFFSNISQENGRNKKKVWKSPLERPYVWKKDLYFPRFE